MMPELCPDPLVWPFSLLGKYSGYFFIIFPYYYSFSVDENGPQLYHMDPSGTYLQFDAKAIGSGSEGAQQSLQEAYHKSITLKEATKTAFTILKQVSCIICPALSELRHLF